MSESRAKFREGVHPVVINHELTVLDAWSGIELLEGHLSSSLAHSLKRDPSDSEIIAHQSGALDTLDAEWELDELRRRGLLDAQPVIEAEPSIVLTTDYLDPQLEVVNGEALESGRPWMLARPRGTVMWIGPVFVPKRGPCWMCLATRLRNVRAAWKLAERRGDDAPVSQLGLDLASLEAARWMRQPHDRARLLTFDTQTLTQREHVVVRKPDCAACGDASTRREFRPLVLQSRKKVFTLDGGHRAAPPEQTYARYEHLVSPITGVVHSVHRAYADSGALNTFVARHNFLIGNPPPSRSLGKGMTTDQARTGALCEALERYSGTFRGDEQVLRATFRELGEEAVHPGTCLLVSERQYDTREQWNHHRPVFLRTPKRFDEEAATDWVTGWSLTHERKRYIAAPYCYYDYPHAQNAFANADSNGNAAGTCIEDAILQGLLELIERDATAMWWYGRLQRPAVAMETPYVAAMRREHAARGRQLRLLDLTTDVGIPVCAAITVGEQPEAFRVGWGAHLDPAIAVSRAISETNQILAVMGKKRPVYRGHVTDWSLLEPQGSREMTTAAPPSDDVRSDVLACVAIFEQLGMEVIVVDQTREDVGLPVVKVIVPGMRHFRPRFAPGRLYDVPHRLGWTGRAMREEELNPAHLA